MNVFNIEKAFKDKAERGWNTLYVAVDAHGTLIKPYHDKIEFYPGTVEVMKWFNKRPDFKVILWTSTHEKEIEDLKKAAGEEGFYFDFVNCNPLEKNSERANFNDKFYFNVLIDDKAGMVPEIDWKLIKEELVRIGEWDKNCNTMKTNKIDQRAVYIGKPVKEGENYINFGVIGFIKQIEDNQQLFFPDGCTGYWKVANQEIYFPQV